MRFVIPGPSPPSYDIVAVVRNAKGNIVDIKCLSKRSDPKMARDDVELFRKKKYRQAYNEIAQLHHLPGIAQTARIEAWLYRDDRLKCICQW